MSKLKLKVSTIGEHEFRGAKFTFNIIPEAEYLILLHKTFALLDRVLVSFSGITIDADDGVIESATREQLYQYPAAAHYVGEIYRVFWLKNAISLTLEPLQELGQG